MKIGVISDTHGFLDRKVLELFAGVGHILHAGDVGDAFVTFELEQIAPVTAVIGNTDSGLHLKETEAVELAARKFLVHHIVNPHALTDKLKARMARENPNAVVFGHTHRKFCETIGGILFFNPGYSGKPKFGVERSAAILHCDEREIRAEFLPL
ncbi:MAG TPA: metallophosphoesterase family protein [Candidatus Aquilonibacter sp.]|nr:metallophosphoesterase family protein [Candidatus Aquilonibacter sp.]